MKSPCPSEAEREDVPPRSLPRHDIQLQIFGLVPVVLSCGWT